MDQYVAFFRGLNVSGRNVIKMHDLKKLLESIGCSNVKTILASGNALFTAPQATPKTLQTKIEALLKETYLYKGNVILRPLDEVFEIAKNNPFKKVKTCPKTRLYVTFLPNPTIDHPEHSLKNFSVIHATDREVFSVLTLTPETGSAFAMKLLDQAYGKTITTRNWNTILKILQSASL